VKRYYILVLVIGLMIASVVKPVVSTYSNDRYRREDYIVVNSDSIGETYSYDNLPYIGRPLKDLYNATLFTLLREASIADYIGGCCPENPLATELGRPGIGGLVIKFNGVNTSDPVLQFGCGRYIGAEKYVNESIGLIVGNSSYEYCYVVRTNIGYEYFNYMDGRVHNLYILSRRELGWLIGYLANYTLYAFKINGFDHLLNLARVNASIVFAGIDPSYNSVLYKPEYKHVDEGIKSTDRIHCGFINPYYKFYIVIGGVRFFYPIRIGFDNVSGSPKIKFIDVYIPPFNATTPFKPIIEDGRVELELIDTTLIPSSKIDEVFLKNDVIIVDKNYLDLIVGRFRNVTGDENASTNNLIIADIYYAPSKDYRYTAPVIKLYRNTSSGVYKVVSMQLLKPGPMVEPVAVIAGTLPLPRDPPTASIHITKHRG
jgi:hypothetical protein